MKPQYVSDRNEGRFYQMSSAGKLIYLSVYDLEHSELNQAFRKFANPAVDKYEVFFETPIIVDKLPFNFAKYEKRGPMVLGVCKKFLAVAAWNVAELVDQVEFQRRNFE